LSESLVANLGLLFSRHGRVPGWLALTAVVENLGFRQLNAFWRLLGMLKLGFNR
jgi:hypothetical protein